jgi:hypothetical protein
MSARLAARPVEIWDRSRVATSRDVQYKWDFFVSYTRADQPWAEWIAWVLEEDGHRVLIQAWDFVPGSNWIQGMQAGTRDAARTIAVLSGSYLDSVYGGVEWQTALASDPDGSGRRLLVARVETCQRPGLLAGVVGIDLFGVPEKEARTRLQSMVKAALTGRAKPTAPPRFPGEARAVPREPSFPGDDRGYTGESAGEPPKDQRKGGVSAGSGNRFQQLRTPVQAGVVIGFLGLLAAVLATVLVLINSHSSPPRSQQHPNLVSLPSKGVDTVAYSFDGNYLAAGNADGRVRVWRTGTWHLVSSMTDPHSRGVNSVAFNPANSLLAAGDANGHIYLWAGGHATVLTDPSGAAVRSVVFSADNQVTVGGDSAGNVYVWRVSSGKVIEPLVDPDSKGVESVAFNASTTTIAAADGNGRVYLWLYKLTRTLKYRTGNAALSVAYSPDDKHLAVASADGNVYVELVDPASGRK